MAARQKAVTTLPNLIRSLKNDRRSPGLSQSLPSLRRAFSLYDQINLIDNVPEDQLRFQRYSNPNFLFSSSILISLLDFILLFLSCGDLRYTETGFTVNGVDYAGSLLCLGNLLMSWSPKKFSEITPERFPLHFFFYNLGYLIYLFISLVIELYILQFIYLPDFAAYSRYKKSAVVFQKWIELLNYYTMLKYFKFEYLELPRLTFVLKCFLLNHFSGVYPGSYNFLNKVLSWFGCPVLEREWDFIIYTISCNQTIIDGLTVIRGTRYSQMTWGNGGHLPRI